MPLSIEGKRELVEEVSQVAATAHSAVAAEYRGLKVPDVLMSGHHAEIEKWRRASSLERTRRHRPDLLEE